MASALIHYTTSPRATAACGADFADGSVCPYPDEVTCPSCLALLPPTGPRPERHGRRTAQPPRAGRYGMNAPASAVYDALDAARRPLGVAVASLLGAAQGTAPPDRWRHCADAIDQARSLLERAAAHLEAVCRCGCVGADCACGLHCPCASSGPCPVCDAGTFPMTPEKDGGARCT